MDITIYADESSVIVLNKFDEVLGLGGQEVANEWYKN